MKTLKNIIAAARVYLGFGELSETRLSPAHGWLLRQPSTAPAGDRQVTKARP